MGDLSGKTIWISGMVIEVLSDDGETCECRNRTTKEPLVMKKPVIDKAIRLGKAEIVTGEEGR